MNRIEQERFLNREVKGLWPKWDATDAELCVWMSSLAPFDYAGARKAAQACFVEQTVNSHRPVLGRFLEKARALSRSTAGGGRRARDVETDVFIDCLEAPKDNPRWAGVRKPVYVHPLSRQSDPDYVMACAESMRKRFERLYGGRWIVVRTRPSRSLPGPERANIPA